MAKKDSVIFYQEQIQICRKYLSNEQFGRLMSALFELDSGGDPEVENDIIMAFEFMSLQQKIDREKYEEKCRKNRENGKKGGRPKKNPEKANGFFQNPNENENENENDKRMRREENDSGLSLFGSLSNVELTKQEYDHICESYEDPNGLIDRVSRWLPKAEHSVPDHYAAVMNFAQRSGWSKKHVIKPPPPEREVNPADMLSEDEQTELVASIARKIGFNPIGD